MSTDTHSPEAGAYGDIDIMPYLMPGAEERTIQVVTSLANLWRDEIMFIEDSGTPRPSQRHRGELTDLELQIIELQHLIWQEDLARDARPSLTVHHTLLRNEQYRLASNRANHSIDRDIDRNFRAYVLDRVAFLAAWNFLHPDSVE